MKIPQLYGTMVLVLGSLIWHLAAPARVAGQPVPCFPGPLLPLPCPEVCPPAPGPIAPDSGVAGVPESQAAAVVDPPAPQVTIRVRVPARVTIGQEIEYRISVENTSRAPAHHVVVRNPLPVGARFV